MRTLLLTLLITLPLASQAQDSFRMGNYWQITAVDTREAYLDDYLEEISGFWRSQMETLVEDGHVKSYKILVNVHPRDGEPNLWLMTEWTSAGAILDAPWEYWDAMADEIVGSMEEHDQKTVARAELRRIMSDLLAREAHLRDPTP